MSPKKKAAHRDPLGAGTYRSSTPVRDQRNLRRTRPRPDSKRRMVTFGIVALGIMIAVGVVMASFGAGTAVAPTQQSGQSGSDARAMEAAVGPLMERLRQNPSDVPAMIALGNAYYDAGRWGDAVPWYEKALQQVPLNTDVRTDLGTAYFYSGNLEKAKEHWFKVLEQEPDKPQTHFNLGILYSQQTPPDTEAAAKEWETVIRVAPGSEQARQAEQNLRKAGKR